MNEKNKARKEYIIYINDYIKRLNLLTTKNIYRENLLSLDNTWRILEQSKILLKSKFNSKFLISFEEKESNSFKKYITNILQKNNSIVYVWIKNTEQCGYLHPVSFDDINWSYPFDFDPNGIVTFTTIDFKNKLSLDNFFDEKEMKNKIEIEVFGEDWGKRVR